LCFEFLQHCVQPEQQQLETENRPMQLYSHIFLCTDYKRNSHFDQKTPLAVALNPRALEIGRFWTRNQFFASVEVPCR
jgi:hypothetical protein